MISSEIYLPTNTTKQITPLRVPAFIKSLENLATRFRWFSLQTELAGGSRFTARVHGPA